MTGKKNEEELAYGTRGSYPALLVALLILFALMPYASGSAVMRWALILASLAMMISALLACWERRRVVFVLALFVVASLAITIVDESAHSALSQIAGNALRVVFFLLVLTVIGGDVLKSKVVTMNTVFGACCLYLMMSLTWAAVYGIVETVHPASFGLDVNGASPASFDADLVYFSVITLTTVGYGDITPITTQAKILSALEGLIGQLFVAIVIARLVALEISSHMNQRS